MSIGLFLLGLIMGTAVGYLLRGARAEREAQAATPAKAETEPAE
jgi:hypothetical protein